MKKHYYILSLFLLATVISQCSDDEGIEFTREKFLGEWEIKQVTYDGVVQDEWPGATLTFSQVSADSGNYFLPETPYDSIWQSLGHWKKSGNDEFYREDEIWVQYDLRQNEMEMVLYLPWTQQNTCFDGICLPVVTGQWTFKMER
jgi:hypothetical protein